MPQAVPLHSVTVSQCACLYCHHFAFNHVAHGYLCVCHFNIFYLFTNAYPDMILIILYMDLYYSSTSVQTIK